MKRSQHSPGRKETMNVIIVTVDLGHFKAYRVTKEALESPRIELIETYDTLEGHGKLTDTLTDTAGRFRGGGGKDEVAKGYGEPHNLVSEIRRKLVKKIATDINDLIKKEDCKNWHFAAGDKINREIVDKLEPKVKTRLTKNITADLTNVPRAEILGYFT